MALAEQSSNVASLRRNHWHLIIGLFWSALLLLLLTYWVSLKHWEEAHNYVVYIIGLTAAGALGLAVQQTLVLRGLADQSEEAHKTHIRKSRIQIGLGLLAISAVVFLAMLLVYLGSGISAFPEVSSSFLLVIFGLVSGFILLSGPERKFSQQQVLEWLVARRGPMQFVSLVLGASLFALGIYLFTQNQWWQIFPQAAGAMLLGLIFVGVGLWLRLASNKEITPGNMRLLILIAGGTAGLVISVMTVLLAFLWQAHVFAGGMESWQSDEAWQLWLCIYAELFGLGLMFGSLYLAQADIHFNAPLRRLLYGYNAVFTGLLVLAALVILNIVVYASFPYNFNWTKHQGFYSLSDRSKNILRNLEERTTVYVLMSQGSEDYMDVQNLLENAQAYTNRLKVMTVSPDQNPDLYRKLKDNYPKLKESAPQFGHGQFGGGGGRGLLVVYGSQDELDSERKRRIPHAFIPSDKLSEDRQIGSAGPDAPPRRHEFKGEDLLMTELSFLVGGQKKPIVYFTQSNGEVDIKDKNFPEGGGYLADKLESANLDVRQLFWGTSKGKGIDELVAYTKESSKDDHKIPGDAKSLVVIVAWPKTEFSPEMTQALGDFMLQGGKLIVLSSIADDRYRVIETGLQDFLKKYGVEMEDDYIVYADSNWLNLLVGRGLLSSVSDAEVEAARSDNPIARAFDNAFIFDTPRTVKPLSGSAGFQAETIFEVVPPPQGYFWAEKDRSTLPNKEFYVVRLFENHELESKSATEAISVAVGVTDRAQNPRLVVFGAGRMASNRPRRPNVPYHDLILSSLEWLGNRPENIGIPPKRSNYYVMQTQDLSTRRLILLPFGLMTLGIVGIGMGVWVVRRR